MLNIYSAERLIKRRELRERESADENRLVEKAKAEREPRV